MSSKLILSLALSLGLVLGANAATSGDDLKDSPITPEQVAQIKLAVEAIRSAAQAEIPAETIGSPDTLVARAALQAKITDGITSYLGTLADIDADLRTFFARIIALKNDADANPKDTVKATLLQNELKRTVPGLNASINQKYAAALRALYLRASYPIVVRVDQRARNRDDFVWYQDNIRDGSQKRNCGDGDCYGGRKTSLAAEVPQSFPNCVTGACVYALSQSMNEWFDIVDSMNQQIDIAHFGLKVDFGSKRTTPFIALSMVDSAERLLKDPKRNVSYTLGAYLTELFVKRTAGVVMGLGAAPALLLEKVGRVAVTVFSAPTIDLTLSLSAGGFFPSEDILSAVKTNCDLYAPTLPAVLYGQEIIDYQNAHQ